MPQNRRRAERHLSALANLAGVYAKQKRWAEAVTLYAVCDALRARLGSPRTPDDQATVDAELAQARQALSKAAFESARAHGRALDWKAAVA